MGHGLVLQHAINPSTSRDLAQQVSEAEAVLQFRRVARIQAIVVVESIVHWRRQGEAYQIFRLYHSRTCLRYRATTVRSAFRPREMGGTEGHGRCSTCTSA